MKKCLQCGNIYTDDSLSYCLSDGTILIFSNDKEQQTVQLPENAVTEIIPRKTEPNLSKQSILQETKGVSRIWLYSTIGLLMLLLGGGLLLWLSAQNSNRNQTGKTEIVKAATPTPIQPTPTVQATSSATVKPKASPIQSPEISSTSSETPEESTYKVVGVASNDVLYLRPNPGNLKIQMAKIPPNTTGIIVIGKGVKFGKAIWYPVIYNGTKGWVNGKFIAKQ